ncbi:MAG: hypothetical protein COC15_04935 [Legionellales bacterium]|nr:MAG: hypothetical protein COC15_04935 [Legionellales bacterium]
MRGSLRLVSTFGGGIEHCVEANYNESILRSMGVRVIHGIDATLLHQYSVLKKTKIPHVYFSHPHTGVYNATPDLIRKFLASAS